MVARTIPYKQRDKPTPNEQLPSISDEMQMRAEAEHSNIKKQLAQSQARWRVAAFSSSSPCWLRAMRTIGRSIVDVGATARTRAGENASPTLWRCRVRSL